MTVIIEALERDLPPATLLLGPEPGALVWDAYRAVMKAHLVHKADALFRRHVSAADARNIVRFAQTAPFGPFKVVIALLDGSTPQAQNILLKVLEEPPGTIRFVLAATERPLPTIVSRCQVVTVPGAGTAREGVREAERQVNAAMQAALAGDLHGLDQALKGWGDAQHAVLGLLAAEAAARDAHGLTRHQARRMLGALGRFSSAHPRLAAHAALTSLVLSDREQHD
jgi:DNA polymerase III, delta subunit